jgi:hypothetical protein
MEYFAPAAIGDKQIIENALIIFVRREALD